MCKLDSCHLGRFVRAGFVPSFKHPGYFCLVPVGPRFLICSACLGMHTFAARLWAFVKPCRVRTNPGWVRLTSCQAWRLRGSCCPSFQTVFNYNLSNSSFLGTMALLTSLNTYGHFGMRELDQPPHGRDLCLRRLARSFVLQARDCSPALSSQYRQDSGSSAAWQYACSPQGAC